MTATTTYSATYGATASSVADAPKRKGMFHRFLDRLIEARMRKAEEVLRQHTHLLPRELEEQIRWKLTERSEDSLPFVR
jgi:hypothetical protein